MPRNSGPVRARLTVPRAFRRGAEGLPQDAQIEPQGLVVDVPDVEGEPVAPGQVSASVDLGPSRDAGQHRVPAPLFPRVARNIADRQRPGTNEAHFAAQGRHRDRHRNLVLGSGIIDRNRGHSFRSVTCSRQTMVMWVGLASLLFFPSKPCDEQVKKKVEWAPDAFCGFREKAN